MEDLFNLNGQDKDIEEYEEILIDAVSPRQSLQSNNMFGTPFSNNNNNNSNNSNYYDNKNTTTNTTATTTYNSNNDSYDDIFFGQTNKGDSKHFSPLSNRFNPRNASTEDINLTFNFDDYGEKTIPPPPLTGSHNNISTSTSSTSSPFLDDTDDQTFSAIDITSSNNNILNNNINISHSNNSINNNSNSNINSNSNSSTVLSPTIPTTTTTTTSTIANNNNSSNNMLSFNFFSSSSTQTTTTTSNTLLSPSIEEVEEKQDSFILPMTSHNNSSNAVQSPPSQNNINSPTTSSTTTTTSIFNLNTLKKAINTTADKLNFSTDRFWNDLGEDHVTADDHSNEFEKWLRLGEDIPHYAWSRRLDQNFADHKQFNVSIWQGLKLMGLGYRMWKYVKKELTAGRLPIMDPFNLPKPGPIMGVPIGGIGSGSINRGWKGDFVRWNLESGIVSNQVVDTDKFSVFINFHDAQYNNVGSITPSKKAVVLYPGKPKTNLNLDVWNWSLKGDNSCYFGLFPRAWTVYEEPHPDIRLICKQVSPVIPHNYKETSYPTGVYEWKIENHNASSDVDISLMLTWQNSIGTESDQAGGHYNKTFSYKEGGSSIKGITLIHKKTQKVDKQVYNDPFELSIAVREDPGLKITYNTRFETTSRLDAANLWYTFNKTGELENTDDSRPSAPKRPIGSAIAVKVTVPAGGSKTIVFSIAWDSPICRFQMGSGYYRRYTKFYGNAGNNSQKIAFDSIQNYKSWDTDISRWQNPILHDPTLPKFYKMALFNELYYFVDGGSVWTNGSVPEIAPSRYPIKHLLKPEDTSDPNSVGRFAYLESLEYLMYNTYDVHFYSSFALISLWPLLEVSLQYDISDSTLIDYNLNWECIHSGSQIPRKAKCAVPHDLGNPGEDPWKRVNAYNIQDVSRWKDLPCKFILQVYRDYLVVQDRNFLLQVYGVVEEVIRRSFEEFDKDKDGVIDNEGFPDQTYDTWSAIGCSAYSGGLWLASLKAASEMAKVLGFKEDQEVYDRIFENGSKSYNKKLWNGHYFNYDSSKSVHANSIMSDMLAGHWYLISCGLESYITFDQALSSLSIINEYNVKSYGKEICGAVNGMRPEGMVDTTCLQSAEVWIGTSFSLAATMLLHRMDKEAWDLVEGIVNSSYQKWGFQYQTPEAWDLNGQYRAAAYMRPLSIWSIQWAIEKRKDFDYYTEYSKTQPQNSRESLLN
ncbi:hypothetical protein CYY_001880 [Polysphondylium violaceum]|uniref:Glucosylceramidase n=1 Tax=Polysphondylium violaceum TaxID=133409 RepID=A0A8J4PXL4_9MYCE|nr:hypothetical protein CYY_001880 [Polysphondylium violaceum]